MVVPNGMRFEDWSPHLVREREVLCVGRASPEKGIKEAALAAVEVLRRHPDWRARFILSEAQVHPAYFMEVRDILAESSGRVTLQESVPWAVVKKHFEAAAIAIVPSRWEEPFGRTALEAHAGGCALVSSGTGGLREISGEHAVYLPNNFSERDISQALDHLIADERRRNFLAAAGREFCKENYSISTVSGRADQCYESVLGIAGAAQATRLPNLRDQRICPEVV
jgi:glycosyltransferase involved in cell wall biosynthesis